MLKVKIKKLVENAVIPFKTHDSDFCYDCVATSEEEIAPGVWKYGLGLAFQIERTHYWFKDAKEHILSIDGRPRSSIWKTGMILSNSEPTIDEDYTGEVSVIFYHVKPEMPRYKVGDRIIQIKLGITIPLEFEEMSELSETERGSGGFGSTGK